MCDPVSIAAAGLALSAATAYVSYDTADKNANRQEKAIKTANDQSMMDMSRQRDQEWAAGAQQMNEAARQAHKDTALFDAINGEYGGGTSVARGDAVRTLQSSEKLATIGSNVKTGMSETGFQSVSLTNQANSRLAAINQPSALGSALQIGAAGANWYQTTYKQASDIEKSQKFLKTLNQPKPVG